MITVDKLYQWDLNRTVTVNDAADEMHWQQPYSSMALRTSIVDGKANIPNIVLQQHGKIKCWSYDSANGRTVNVYEIDISRRQKPDNYIYTEKDAVSIEQYIDEYLSENPLAWDSMGGKPETFPPSEHDHDGRYVKSELFDDSVNSAIDDYFIDNPIDWDDIDNKPTEFTPSSHDHDNLYYTKEEADTKAGEIISDYIDKNPPSWDDITDKPSAFTPSSHNHDDIYYTMTDVNLLLGGLASADHNHDTIYYTKTNANNLFQSKPTYVKDISTTVISVTPNDNTEYVFTQTASAVEVILPTMTEGFHCAISWHNGTTSFTLNEGDYTVAMLVNGEVTNTYTPEASKIVLMTIHYNGDYVLITINEF